MDASRASKRKETSVWQRLREAMREDWERVKREVREITGDQPAEMLAWVPSGP